MLIIDPTKLASIGRKMNEILEKIVGAHIAWIATAAATVPAALVLRSS
jgi:hypothetical protein